MIWLLLDDSYFYCLDQGLLEESGDCQYQTRIVSKVDLIAFLYLFSTSKLFLYCTDWLRLVFDLISFSYHSIEVYFCSNLTCETLQSGDIFQLCPVLTSRRCSARNFLFHSLAYTGSWNPQPTHGHWDRDSKFPWWVWTELICCQQTSLSCERHQDCCLGCDVMESDWAHSDSIFKHFA